MNGTLVAALRYHALGMNPLPIMPGGVEPLVKWKLYQTTRVSDSEIHDWWHRWPEANVGIITGQISGIVVLDADPRNGPGLPLDARTCSIVATPRGGFHFYYAYHPVATTAHPLGAGTPVAAPGLDVQSDHAFVVAPPSRRYGKTYHFVDQTDQWLAHLPPLPEDIVERLCAAGSTVVVEPARPLPRVGSAGHGIDLDMALRILEADGRPAKQTGPGQYMARCPLHDDVKPSLALSTGTDGQLLLHCHARCTFSALIRHLSGKTAEVTR